MNLSETFIHPFHYMRVWSLFLSELKILVYSILEWRDSLRNCKFCLEYFFMICYRFWKVWLFHVCSLYVLDLNFTRGRAKDKCRGIWWVHYMTCFYTFILDLLHWFYANNYWFCLYFDSGIIGRGAYKKKLFIYFQPYLNSCQ